MEQLRIAVIGAGAIAQRNANEAANSGAATVVGVFDVNAKVARQMADGLKASVYGSYEAALSDPKVEAVLMSTPHHVHKTMTIQAAAAGKHVMVEKPIATKLSDADEMIKACKKAGVALTVNYSFRYLPKVQKARQLVADGALGEIMGVQIIAHQFKDPGYWMGARSNSPDDWRSSREKCGGGFLIMNVCHTLDYLYYITGLSGTRVYSEYRDRHITRRRRRYRERDRSMGRQGNRKHQCQFHHAWRGFFRGAHLGNKGHPRLGCCRPFLLLGTADRRQEAGSASSLS